MIKDIAVSQALILPVEAAINHVLKSDPASLAKLAEFNGKTLAVSIAGTLTGTLRGTLRVLSDGISISLVNDTEPDVLLTGTSKDFLNLAKAENKASELINSDIQFNGDVDLALAITRILQGLDIDFEAMIAPLTGGLVAHQIGSAFRGLLKWGKSTGKTYASMGQDYLLDEAKLVAPKPLIDTFGKEVDNLKLATDRLTARLQRIESLAQAKLAAKDIS